MSKQSNFTIVFTVLVTVTDDVNRKYKRLLSRIKNLHSTVLSWIFFAAHCM